MTAISLAAHLLEVPAPIVFNLWKHHAGAIRRRIQDAAALGREGVAALPTAILVLGDGLMDLYLGPLTPAEIAERVMHEVRRQGVASASSFHDWVDAHEGYRVIELADDAGSRWTLRASSDAERFIHLHPGRWSPRTCRVRTNVLKTAVMVAAHTTAFGGDPLNVDLVNAVRSRYLAFAPVQRVSRAEGLGEVIALLAE